MWDVAVTFIMMVNSEEEKKVPLEKLDFLKKRIKSTE